ncbi:MAG: ATPase, T2SS/T4P/T4SS family, partial [Dehalococcoidia bacterium]|nr:ATPase, T2SS/T4P/T4SS family [Dehalococcoidia bacterium]
YSLQGHEVDFRVASIDTNHGEMVVMRLLHKSVSFLQLSDISIEPDILELYSAVLDSPYGMVLVSGPPGSGKTTSLYASLRQFDPKDRKIMTIEDPIEYKVPGISQIQINRQAGVTFSTGLRGILRLDPDVILVGEVRDSETAEIAVQAALTGAYSSFLHPCQRCRRRLAQIGGLGCRALLGEFRGHVQRSSTIGEETLCTL